MGSSKVSCQAYVVRATSWWHPSTGQTRVTAAVDAEAHPRPSFHVKQASLTGTNLGARARSRTLLVSRGTPRESCVETGGALADARAIADTERGARGYAAADDPCER